MKKIIPILLLFALFFLFGCDRNSKNKYTITFDTDGGSIIEAIIEKHDVKITMPPSPTKEGYTFTGWNPEFPSKMPKEDIVLNALWQVNQYTISFNTDGGSIIEPIIQDFNTIVNEPDDPIKEGHTFDGWDQAVPAKMPSKNTVINALWQINQYTISFNTNRGSIIEPVTQDFNTIVNAPDDPTKEGYTFIGWDQAIPLKMPSNNIELNALWQTNQYTISFNSNGGSIVDSITQDYDSDINPPINPTRDYYTFIGWDQEVPSKMPSKNTVINALWQINQYTISFNTDGGSIIEPITQDYDTEVETPKEPTKEFYTFIGWDQAMPSKMPGENIVLNALWQVNQYTISFNTGGGSIIDSITQDFNTIVNAPDDPIKEGHTFDGWDQAMPSKMPGENIVLNAIWKINQYTISFNTDGGSIIEPIIQDFNTIVNAPDDPTKEGHTFDDWDQAIPLKMPSENTVLNAKWKVNQYTITFNTDGGTFIESITQDFDTIIDAINDPIKDFYVFIGWDQELPLSMPSQNITLTALWELSTYFYLGEYPQSLVVDNDIIDVLMHLTETNANGYLEYNGDQYIKNIGNPYYDSYTFINGQKIIAGEVYFFKVEPIKWRILEDDDGTITMITDMILDQEDFYTVLDDIRIIGEESIYPNNYEYSTLRAWLNNDFYNLAFNDSERAYIQTSLVDNSASTTNNEVNQYECNNTMDKVYALSYQDIIANRYGINITFESNAVVSEYARANHVITPQNQGIGYYWLRSPNSNSLNGAFCASNVSGAPSRAIFSKYIGVRPVIAIKLN